MIKKKKVTNFPLKHGWKHGPFDPSEEKLARKRGIRKALYEDIGSKHVRRRKRGKICFGIMRLQTLRNGVSPNFIHSSRWIHGDTVHNLNPPIDGDNRDTRCRRGVPSTRPSACREDERGIRNSRRDIAGGERWRREGNKPLGTRRVQTVSSSSSSSREIPKKLSLGACWLVARSWPTESRVGMIFPNLRKVDRLISRKGIGDDCRAVLHGNREIIKLWACHENERNLSILYLYIRGIEQKVALEIGYIFKTIYDFVSKTSDREKERYFFSVFFIALTNRR